MGVKLCGSGQVFASLGQVRVKFLRVWVNFCQFLPVFAVVSVERGVRGLFWGFWEIGTQ